MERLKIEELIEHCDRQINKLPSGTKLYQERESVRTYLQTLRHYIATKLTPEEILEVQEALKPIPFGRFREIMEAERDGRMDVIPCKTGDYLYVADHFEKCVTLNRIMSVTVYQNEVAPEGIISIEMKCADGPRPGEVRFIYADEIGKSAFSRREKAERALEQMKGEEK